MVVSLISTSRHPILLKRLQGLGFRVQKQSRERIRSLEPDSTDLVYVVPIEATHAASWPQDRVSLARASRYYVVSGHELRTADIMEAARDGAYDVLDNADDDTRWQSAIENAANAQALWWQLYGAKDKVNEKNLIGRTPVMNALRESIQRIGPTPATVLVMGESGTGKERVAEAVHAASGRNNFVTVNCAAIPAELMESELFGVEKGAYTGANQSRIGLVEEAAAGTLFLDEIGEMDISLQPKLLRFLETRKARRVGSTKEYNCDVRVISATNRDLKAESETGRFRLDLYYRLSEVVIDLPPLRHRTADIPDLVKLFMDQAAVRLGKNFETIEPELIYKFQLYGWPGNVRELKQAIDRLAIHYDGPMIRAQWWQMPGAAETPPVASTPAAKGETRLPFALSAPVQPNQPEQTVAYPYRERAPSVASQQTGSHKLPSRKEKLSMARRLIEESGGDLTWVAAQLGIHPTTLYRWRKSGKV